MRGKRGEEEKQNGAPGVPAEVPGTRPVSVGNKQTRKHNVDSPLEAHDPSSLRALAGGGRVPSVAVRRPRLRSVALYVTAGGQCTLSTPLQLSVSSAKCSFRMDAVRTNGGGAMPAPPTPSPFALRAKMRNAKCEKGSSWALQAQ